MESHKAVNWPMSSSVARRTRYFDELTPPTLGFGPENSKPKFPSVDGGKVKAGAVGLLICAKSQGTQAVKKLHLGVNFSPL
jgi:hypothetical protein